MAGMIRPFEDAILDQYIIIILVILAIFVAIWQRWIASSFDYQCAHCGAIFDLPFWQAMIAFHAMGKKLVRCPNCGEMTWAMLVPKDDDF